MKGQGSMLLKQLRVGKKQLREESNAILYHSLPELLDLPDLLALRLAVSKEQVTILAGDKKEFAMMLLLSRYYQGRTISITKKPPQLSTRAQDTLKSAMHTLKCVTIVAESERMGFAQFLETINLFVGISEMELSWYRAPQISPAPLGRENVLTPQNVSQFISLKRLSLQRAEISQADVVHFERLSVLTDLRLCWCVFIQNSEQELRALTQLTALDISNPRIIDYGASEEYLTSMTQLQKLTLGSFQKQDISRIECIGGVISLQKLHLCDTKTLTDQRIKSFLNLTNLSELFLEQCWNITISGIACLTSLRKLESLAIIYEETWFTHAEGTSLEPLTHFSRLRSLSLSGVPDSCDHLNSTSPGIDNEALKDIAKMTGLTSLSVFASPADYNCLKSLSRLTQLEFLELHLENNSESMADDVLKMFPRSVKKMEINCLDSKVLQGLYTHPALTCLDLQDKYTAGMINPDESDDAAKFKEDLDEIIRTTPNLLSITGLYGPKELTERRQKLKRRYRDASKSSRDESQNAASLESGVEATPA